MGFWGGFFREMLHFWVFTPNGGEAVEKTAIKTRKENFKELLREFQETFPVGEKEDQCLPQGWVG